MRCIWGGGGSKPSRDMWLAQLERDRERVRNAAILKTPAHRIEEDLRRVVEVRALSDGNVVLMRMGRDEFERCLGEYRHLPWTILEARIVGGAARAGIEGGSAR